MFRLLFPLLLICPLFSFAVHQNESKLDNDEMVIEGKITDTLTKLKRNERFVITLSISAFPANITTAPITRYVVEADSNNYFKVAIKVPAARFYMHMNFSPNGDSFIDNIFILEKGDRINCRLSKGNFEFSGKGSDKLNCQNLIYKIRYNASAEYINFAKSKNVIGASEAEGFGLDSVLKLRLAVVESFRIRLGSEMTNIMLANCYGLRYYTWLRAARLTNPFRFLSTVSSPAYRKLQVALPMDLETRALIASPNYTDFVLEFIEMENMERNGGKRDRSKEYVDWIYDKIMSSYSGMIREKLLTSFFLKYQKVSVTLPLMDEAVHTIKSEEYKAIIDKIINTRAIGNSFYPFSLEDVKGKTVHLNDFRGKVVLIDFWFTGCGPCKLLNGSMDPVIKHFKGNDKVRFVSISVDPNRAMWIKSVSTGEYTHAESVNLYVGGKMDSTEKLHPLIRTYNINSFPTLFLLKDGKIFDFNPPRPSPKDNSDLEKGNTKKMVDLINNALSSDK